IRGWISKRPVLFGLIGGFAVVEFWRGVWHLTDYLFYINGTDPYGWVSSTFSIVIGGLIMLSTGLYVSLFVGDSIIISGIKKEKKFFEKTIDELSADDQKLRKIESQLANIEKVLLEIKK
ncbi:MAG: hypothetical protein WAV11_01275, partial [Minisyncoccia bacterium]